MDGLVWLGDSCIIVWTDGWTERLEWYVCMCMTRCRPHRGARADKQTSATDYVHIHV